VTTEEPNEPRPPTKKEIAEMLGLTPEELEERLRQVGTSDQPEEGGK
jgi:DNA-directed RNA polymerase specialized sigma subunit